MSNSKPETDLFNIFIRPFEIILLYSIMTRFVMFVSNIEKVHFLNSGYRGYH